MAESIFVSGLTDFDLAQLEEDLPEGSVSRPELPDETTDRHGDLGLTAAIVIVTVAAIQGLSLWMAKRHLDARDKSHMTYEKDPNGRVRIDLKIDRKLVASDAADPKLVKANQETLLKAFQLG